MLQYWMQTIGHTSLWHGVEIWLMREKCSQITLNRYGTWDCWSLMDWKKNYIEESCRYLFAWNNSIYQWYISIIYIFTSDISKVLFDPIFPPIYSIWISLPPISTWLGSTPTPGCTMPAMPVRKTGLKKPRNVLKGVIPSSLATGAIGYSLKWVGLVGWLVIWWNRWPVKYMHHIRAQLLLEYNVCIFCFGIHADIWSIVMLYTFDLEISLKIFDTRDFPTMSCMHAWSMMYDQHEKIVTMNIS